MSFGTPAEDSDCELELLALDNGAQIFGDHELKTAPLVIRDVTSLSDGFVQRALLGKVLSVHSNGIPSRTQDPRIYMNLDAPSSGLVCGVQVSLDIIHCLWCSYIHTGLGEKPYCLLSN
jgi:hypothetical protein